MICQDSTTLSGLGVDATIGHDERVNLSLQRVLPLVAGALPWLGLVLPVISFPIYRDATQRLTDSPASGTLLPAAVILTIIAITSFVPARSRRWAIAAIVGSISMLLALGLLLLQEGLPYGQQEADGTMVDGIVNPMPSWGFGAALLGAVLMLIVGVARYRAARNPGTSR